MPKWVCRGAQKINRRQQLQHAGCELGVPSTLVIQLVLQQ